jgi:hypothetical protein
MRGVPCRRFVLRRQGCTCPDLSVAAQRLALSDANQGASRFLMANRLVIKKVDRPLIHTILFAVGSCNEAGTTPTAAGGRSPDDEVGALRLRLWVVRPTAGRAYAGPVGAAGLGGMLERETLPASCMLAARVSERMRNLALSAQVPGLMARDRQRHWLRRPRGRPRIQQQSRRTGRPASLSLFAAHRLGIPARGTH